MNLRTVSHILGIFMFAAVITPTTVAASPDIASAEEQRQARQQKATVYREMRQQALANNPSSASSVEEVRRQSLQQKVAVRWEAQRQAVAEKDAARRAEASRLIMERNAKD